MILEREDALLKAKRESTDAILISALFAIRAEVVVTTLDGVRK
jgi:hypothetical protein